MMELPFEAKKLIFELENSLCFMVKRFIVVISCMLILNCEHVFAQCGLTPGYYINQAFGQYDWVIIPNNTLNPNWKVYAWEWTDDGQVISNQINVSHDMQHGYNLICLKQWATDTITGDSCEAEYCNILYASFDIPLEIRAFNNSGTTVDFEGYSGPYAAVGTFDFGDGTYGTNWDLDTHTYAAPGHYNVTYQILTGESLTRKIHVGNGYSNINAYYFSGTQTGGCDSTFVYFSSNPPFDSGIASIIHNLNSSGSTSITNGIGSYISYYNEMVPGTYWVNYYLSDTVSFPNTGNTNHLNSIIINVCNTMPDTVSGYVFSDVDADGIWDSSEFAIPNFEVWINYDYHAKTDSSGYYEILVPSRDVMIRTAQPPAAITMPATNYYYVQFNSGSLHPGFNFGVSDLDVTICGKVFIDYNQDSAFSAANDLLLSNNTIKAYNYTLQKEFYTTSNNFGNYCFELPGGDYFITPINTSIDSIYFYPDSIFINSTSGYFNFQDFASFSTQPGSDPETQIGPWNDPRPGFNYSLGTRVYNSGIDSCSSIIVLNYDSTLTYVSSSPANGIVNQINKTITWPTGMIKSGVYEYFSATFTVPVAAALGTILTNSSIVAIDPGYTDHDTTNNFYSFNDIVIGSFDPNDKSVTPTGTSGTGDVHHDTRLNYRINFQNTGTASAINVVVQDDIDEGLDLNSLLVQRTSHTGNLSTFGRTLTWTFPNINLPDSNTNEPASHGFIEYSIKPIQGQPDGTTIENEASIYFDYNNAVITNTTLNTLQTNITTTTNSTSGVDIEVFPIPFNNYLNIRIPETEAKLNIRINDFTGRLLFVENYNTKSGQIVTIPTAKFSKGIYFLELTNGTNSFVRKIIK